MFQVKIAGVAAQIDNRYPYVESLCRDYIVSGESPAFTIGASDEEQVREQGYASGYSESLCLYRKLCLNMIDYDGFLMHSAVIEVNGQAIAFAAKSGVGKSTHIRLWQERFGSAVHIINGDKPIYRFIGGQLYACGTPWKGKEGWGVNAMAPLKAICFLERDVENHLEPMVPGDALVRLFHQLLLPREQDRMDRFLVLIDRMLMNIPCWRLCCNKSPEAAETARRALLEGEFT